MADWVTAFKQHMEIYIYFVVFIFKSSLSSEAKPLLTQILAQNILQTNIIFWDETFKYEYEEQRKLERIGLLNLCPIVLGCSR